ncbi:MAG TPA: hypothetical protein VMU08_10785 [Rhizomicrobium sp.]|nr:hypothetical protein [Rhizomicrobium sp.]
MADLVPGRECGECAACCSYYEIARPELRKPRVTLCPYWKGGCTIYDTRPDVCRDFFCLWRKAPTLDDWWRPDRCGVIIREVYTDIPAHMVARAGLIFDLAGDPAVIDDDRFIQAVASQILSGVPVFLRTPNPDGADAGKVFLNDRMASAVAARDRARLVAALHAALADAIAMGEARP